MIRVVKKMPEYLMCVKDVFSSKKSINDEDAVKLNDRCSTILLNQLPPKENDLGSFTLLCLIGSLNIKNASANIGAINVMPYSMFKRLNLGNLQPTNMITEMTDKTKKSPRGILENVLVQIDKFIYPIDLVIIDMVEDPKAPLILGRPLPSTIDTRIDVFNKQILSGGMTAMGNYGVAGIPRLRRSWYSRNYPCPGSCLDFRRLSRGGVKIEQFSALQSKVREVVLSDHEDSWLWTLHFIGYTVASA
uniref:Reverse transcriptase domain-containing protein n=1 Tax=Tanacetum cinerariifolium TaxID=118510 RepID=A0A6L2LLZ6_TANCI|nr:hypothetical protein [Tanacetum cinerariifolium]